MSDIFMGTKVIRDDESNGNAKERFIKTIWSATHWSATINDQGRTIMWIKDPAGRADTIELLESIVDVYRMMNPTADHVREFFYEGGNNE